MNTIQKRFLLFTFCILSRLLLVIIVKYINPEYLKHIGFIGGLIGLSFIYLFLTNSRVTGPEVFGGKIWWNKFRIVHGILYLIFAYLSFKKPKQAWKPLLLDVILGFLFFLNYHYIQGNFKILFN